MNEIKLLIETILNQIDEKKSQVDNQKMLNCLQDKYEKALEEINTLGKINTDLKWTTRMYLEAYDDYINNPLINNMDKLSLLIEDKNNKIPPSEKIYSNICKSVLKDVKTPHSISQPVIYNENGKYYLAIFIFFFSKEDIENGAVDRPTVWALADLKTGKIIEERQTKDIDFSDASYDVKYNVRADAQYDTTKKYYDEAFKILDCVRENLIQYNKFCKIEYKTYLDKILANIPKEYQRFYLDLSL